MLERSRFNMVHSYKLAAFKLLQNQRKAKGYEIIFDSSGRTDVTTSALFKNMYFD